MRRTAFLKCLLVSGLLALPWAAEPAAAAPLALKAALASDGKALEVRVEGPLPRRAIITLKVTREFVTPTRHPPVVLTEVLLSFQEAGRAEALLEIGEALAVPGRYRVQAAFESQGQYPEVLKALGDSVPEPAEVVLAEALASKGYLEALLKEQAHLAEALTEVRGFLDRMNDLEAEVARDRAQGLAAWAAWRAQARPGLERIIAHGRRARESLYPETHDRFSEAFVYSGLFQMEDRKFGAVQAAGEYHGTGSFGDKPRVFGQDLEPCETLFRMETVYFRLAVMNGLYNAVLQELAVQGKRPDPARWDSKRAEWGEILSLWKSDLGPPDPALPAPYVKQMLHRDSLSSLGEAMAGWLDAKDDERPARQQAVVERFREVRDLLQKK